MITPAPATPASPRPSPVGARDIASYRAKHLVRRGCNVGTLDRLSTGHRNALLGRAFVQGDLAERDALDASFSSCAFDAMVASQAGYATKAHDRHY